METITIKRTLAEDALRELKLAQADHFVQSTRDIIDELEVILRPQIMQVGTILIATDPCKMNFCETEALVVDKEYAVIEASKDEIFIESEFNEEHCFSMDILSEFFIVKPAL